MRSIRSSWLGRTRKIVRFKESGRAKTHAADAEGREGEGYRDLSARQCLPCSVRERSRCVFVPDAPLLKAPRFKRSRVLEHVVRGPLLICLACGVDPGLVRNSLMAGFALPGKIV